MPEAQAQGRPAADEGQGKSLLQTILQSVGIFLLVQAGIKFFMPQKAPVVDPAESGSVASTTPNGPNVVIPAWENRPRQLDHGVQYNPIPWSIAPMWPLGTELDIQMYISASLAMPPLSAMPKQYLLVDEKKFVFGDWNENREVHAEFKVPKEVQQNATLFAHFFVGKSGCVLDPMQQGYNIEKAYHLIRPLSQYLPKKKIVKTRNLLSDMPERDAQETEEEKKAPKVVASYYHPNFTISLIPDAGTLSYPNMHPGPRRFLQLDVSGARDASGQHGWYYPIVFTNTFWQLKKHMVELNETVTTLPLNVKLNNLAHWKYNLMASVDENLRANAAAAAAGQPVAGGGGDGSEMEMVKEILIDSNSYLLAITGVVSVLHMIFEMLAFKNDVQHWRKKKDNVGTSVRTILANVFMQGVIFLYLLDNNENTSWMILFGQGMGMAIEAWKITKSVNVRVRPTAPGSLLPYSVVFEDKHVLSETEKKTEEYDQIAFRYMYMIAIPLVFAYAVYSLMYDSHKSWYSFIITTLVGSVYAYGFLMMVPSLYINYRLQSVAHMPGRAMTYKFLNTFIDDLFAFTIKMPTLHRLATLRDDVIFFVYLFQTWKYKVDYSRVNEFGQGGGDEDETEDKKADKDKKALPPSTGGAGKASEEQVLAQSAEKIQDIVENKDTAQASGSQKKSGAKQRKK